MNVQFSPVLVSIRSAAAMLGIGRSKTYELIDAGELKTCKIGSRRLVRVDSVTALLERTAA